MHPILSVQNIKKTYGKLKAVDEVSFEVKKGSCFGLLGPNGAGKTTLMEMVEMVTQPDSGGIFYQNQPLTRAALHQMGVQFQETALPHFLTVKETLEIFSALYPRQVNLNELIELCQLKSFQNQKHNQISGGQRQRLLLAIALCNDPELILLDEPTTGLDPQARRHLWSIVKDIKKRGKTLILTTHYMEEAYELCDEIGIMDHGKMIAYGKPKDLLKAAFSEVIVLLPKEAIQPHLLQSYRYTESEHQFEFATEDLNRTLSDFMTQGVDLSQLTTRQSSLEDLFIKLTGKQIRT